MSEMVRKEGTAQIMTGLCQGDTEAVMKMPSGHMGQQARQKKSCSWTGKTTQQFRTLDALASDPDLITITCIRPLTASCLSSCKGSDALFWPLQALHTHGTHTDQVGTHTHTHTHLHKNTHTYKINKFLKMSIVRASSRQLKVSMRLLIGTGWGGGGPPSLKALPTEALLTTKARR